MHSFLAVLFLVSAFFSCSPTDPVYAPPQGPEAVSQAIYSRQMAGDTIPFSPELLEKVLPESPDQWTPLATSSSVFLTRSFSSAKRLYAHPQSHPLQITLSDYANDSAAFMFIYLRYLREADSSAIPFNEPFPKESFVWVKKNNPGFAMKAEAGLYNRYHISISGNIHTPDSSVFQMIREMSHILGKMVSAGKK
ncbi:MAG: hypothetical protein R3C61_27935 [Bacteroidia bacterium]